MAARRHPAKAWPRRQAHGKRLPAARGGTMPRWIITFGREALIGLFWVWGLFGLIGNLLTLNGQIGIEASSSQLLWIGGMLLFGLGALLIKPGASK